VREFKIVPIRNGTVLDHIEAGKALEILRGLGMPVPGSAKVVSVSMNLPSSRGLKDVLKFEDVELSDEDLDKVRSISATGTWVTIRNYDVVEKTKWGSVPKVEV